MKKTYQQARTVRQLTIRRDERDNYKLLDLKLSFFKNKESSSLIHLQRNNEQYLKQFDTQYLNSSCVCEECGGKIKKNQILCFNQDEPSSFLASQQHKISMINKKSQMESHRLTSSIISNKQSSHQQLICSPIKQSVAMGFRKSITPIMHVMQASNILLKMTYRHQEEQFPSPIPVQTNTLLDKVSTQVKHQATKSLANSPLQFRTRTTASIQFLSKLTPLTVVKLNKEDIPLRIKQQRKSQPGEKTLSKSQKFNQVHSLQKRLMLTYLRDQHVKVEKLCKNTLKVNRD